MLVKRQADGEIAGAWKADLSPGIRFEANPKRRLAAKIEARSQNPEIKGGL